MPNTQSSDLRSSRVILGLFIACRAPSFPSSSEQLCYVLLHCLVVAPVDALGKVIRICPSSHCHGADSDGCCAC